MKLPNWRYEQIKEKVTNLLINNLHEIPCDVFKLAKSIGIILVPYSLLNDIEYKFLHRLGQFITNDGFLMWKQVNNKKKYFIYYNDKTNEKRIRFTIMHEIGHCVLNHTQQSDLAEAEANFFAKYGLAPPVLVNLINPEDYVDIANVFNLSHEFAWNSFIYYQQWKKSFIRKGNQYSMYEILLLNNFGLLIRKVS